ncbi:hypothetical protein LCGC14_2296790 [marine sediment metagenome]|uniref:Uncharacterized protein n=1 Tax=marine sediment metagenome TaxID=412755 RepID=A0A0F9FJT3_9ZZZZ
MKISIYCDLDNKMQVTVEGESGDSPERVAQAYLVTWKELNKEDD